MGLLSFAQRKAGRRLILPASESEPSLTVELVPCAHPPFANEAYFLECANLSALWYAATCRRTVSATQALRSRDESRPNKAATSRRTPKCDPFRVGVVLGFRSGGVALRALPPIRGCRAARFTPGYFL